MYISGFLDDYDNIVLPLSRKQVEIALLNIQKRKSNLNQTDQFLLDNLRQKFGISDSSNVIGFFDSFPNKFLNNLIAASEKHLYFYHDSIVKFNIDPVFESKFIYSHDNQNTSTLLNFGGRIKGSYDDWLGFYVEAANGSVFGDRATAKLDKRIEQSYTFNNTKINYFDNTQGYIKFQKGIINLQLGRERIIWGAGQINKLILSDNPQIFDFVKFHLNYKSLSYEFLHGWLVMHPEFIKIYNDISKEKRSKYIAISRLGINPNYDLFLGVSQIIIYSNRPFEVAYLNPFLFWESAQRSMNDLDNSFLSFDGRYRIHNGLMLNASAIFDDINFSRLFKGEWNGHNNGFAWQTGITITDPLLFSNLVLDLEYLQLRPYIFSHPGYSESLTYTNNGYRLGVDLNPNSTLFSVKVSYNVNERLSLSFYFHHLLHGNNEYDSVGNRTRNVGGNIFEYYTINDSKFANLLDGVLETENRFQFGFDWELFNGIYLKLSWEKRKNSLDSAKNFNVTWGSLSFNFD